MIYQSWNIDNIKYCVFGTTMTELIRVTSKRNCHCSQSAMCSQRPPAANEGLGQLYLKLVD